VTARTFIWISIGGGAWSLAGNWNDQTDGVDPSALAPGPQDDAIVAGPEGSAAQTITGTGTVAAAMLTGNTILSGSFSAGTLTIGTPSIGGVLQLASGTQMLSSSASLAAGSLLVNGANTTLSVAGTLGVGDGLVDGLSAGLDVTGGGTANVLGLLMDVANCQIYVDPASVLEVGGQGRGQTGYLTVDPQSLLSGEGDANAYGDVANNGTVAASGGTLTLGAVSGTGSLVIDAGATLELNGACGAGQAVAFAGANGVLDLQAEYYAPAGTVSGFAAGDSIDESGSLISSATFTASGAGGGILTLYYGGQVAGRIALAGNYLGSTFLTSGDGDGGTLITVATAASSGGTASPGTATPDQYLWTGQGSGQWNTAANWQDQTTGANPASVAPGAKNVVSIAVSETGFTVIAGPANAATLSLTGELALAGKYAIGVLEIGAVSGTAFTNGTLDLQPGTTIAASAAAINAGDIAVAGSGASLTVAGTLTLGGGIAGVGLPVTALTITSGARVQAGTLAIGGGSGDSITTDPTGSLEIGTLGGAAAGAVTVDKGALLTGSGSVNPLGPVIDNGSIVATGGTLTMGTVTGTGTLQINNGLLDLNYATAVPIQFVGTSAILALAGVAAAPTGQIEDMVQGDLIDILGDPVTSAAYNTANNGANATIQLYYGHTQVGQLLMTGNFNYTQMITVPDGHGGTFLELTPPSGGGGGTGQAGTDQLAWTGSQDGDWSDAGNWNDLTTGNVATLPPGAQTPATIAGPQGTQYQTVSGTGTSASLAMSGNLYISGVFGTGALSFGVDATATASAVGGTLVTYPWSTLTASSVLVADGLIQANDNNVLIDIKGALTLGDGLESPSMTVEAGAVVNTGSLALGGGTLFVDAFSVLEVGTLGTGSAGTLTIDPGFSVGGQGTLNLLGQLTDNGTITAQGGTLAIGAAGGAGSMNIAAESALSLSRPVALPIDFAGAGGELVVVATADLPSGPVGGFAPGDSILVSGSPVSAVSYQPGTGAMGTLTLLESGQIAGTLLLSGNYAGDVFAVAPDGAGAAITVAVNPGGGIGGPPAGTTTPDQYVWTGSGGVQWASAASWQDTTQGQTPAATAPGQNDLVTIASAAAATSVTGPGDAALLTLTGTVSLGGLVAAGTLAVGTAQLTGVLALGNADVVTAGSAAVLGGVAGQGGTLVVGGTVSLGDAAGAAGLLDATSGSAFSAGAVVMQGAGTTLVTDASSSIEIGGDAGAAAGSVTIDQGGVLSGSGTVDSAGQVIDNGQVQANGGTLALGAISGDGTLLVGLGADLLLAGAAASGLTADFAGAGTLTLTQAGFAAAIEDFGPSDSIILTVSGATGAIYTLDGPGTGVLTILDGNQVLQTLTLLGNVDNEVFNVAGAPGGGTVLTASPASPASIGGDTVPSDIPDLVPGSNSLTQTQLTALAQYYFPSALTFVQEIESNLTCDLWYLDGESTVGAPLYGGDDQPPGVDMELIPTSQNNEGSPTNYVLQPGYDALIAEGTEPVNLFDENVGNALLVGNAYSGPTEPTQPTQIVTYENGDTLVGAAGANTVFFATGSNDIGLEQVSVVGGGNDTIVTNEDNASVTTSGGGHSLVFVGASDNAVTSQGNDDIICGGDTARGSAQDTVTAAEGPGETGPTVFGPPVGYAIVYGDASDPTVVGGGGELVFHGGSTGGNVLWAGPSAAFYFGGTGSAILVGGSQLLEVHGGSGPVTVYGGTGQTIIQGYAGNSTYVVGEGATTISAGAGNVVYAIGSAPISVAGASGLVLYAGQGTGNYIFDASGGSETLWGGEGTDQFVAGTGNDLLVSGGGVDSFKFINGLAGGNDVIYNFRVGLDTIVLQSYGGGIPTLTVENGSTYFSLTDGTRVEVEGVTNLTASSFNLT
jgi:hypothetical protein